MQSMDADIDPAILEVLGEFYSKEGVGSQLPPRLPENSPLFNMEDDAAPMEDVAAALENCAAIAADLPPTSRRLRPSNLTKEHQQYLSSIASLPIKKEILDTFITLFYNNVGYPFNSLGRSVERTSELIYALAAVGALYCKVEGAEIIGFWLFNRARRTLLGKV